MDNQQQYYGTGRRKTARARVFMREGNGKVLVNGRTLDVYFSRLSSRKVAMSAAEAVSFTDSKDFYITVRGGGESVQAGAVRLGIARAVVEYEGELKEKLRLLGMLSRDSREVERKKVGYRKARRSRQYSKR